MAHLDYEFVEGVEGRHLDLSDAGVVDPSLGNGPYWSGAVGCYLSHLKVHKKVLETDAERALVLEDDVVLPQDMTTLIDAVSANMAGAEAVLLHHHRIGRPEHGDIARRKGQPYRFLNRYSVPLPGSRMLATPADVGDLGGTGAYLITREACQRMVTEMLPVRTAVDDWEFFRNEGVLDSVRCVLPMPVLTDKTFRTTIDHYAPNSLQTRLRNAVIRVPVLSQALAMRRRRLEERGTRVEVVDDA